MNRWSYAALPVLLLACSKLLTIRVEEESTTVVEQGTLLEDIVGDLGFEGFMALDISESTELKNQGVEPGDIKEVFLEELVLEADGDLSFIEELEFFVESEGLPRQRIAYQTSFPEGETRSEMVLEDVDLTEYVVAESMDITTEVVGTRPEEDTEITGLIALSVGVTAKGACNQVK